LHFLDSDKIVRDNFLTRPIGALVEALRDLGEGAKPPLFFRRPKRRRGRPTGRAFDVARGAIAAAVGWLIEWGEGRQAAAKLVADELHEIGMKLPSGKAIGPKQVLRWRDETGATASTVAQKSFQDARAKYADVRPEIAGDPKMRRVVVAGALLAIWSLGFWENPNIPGGDSR
jgi:hypothetical protein